MSMPPPPPRQPTYKIPRSSSSFQNIKPIQIPIHPLRSISPISSTSTSTTNPSLPPDLESPIINRYFEEQLLTLLQTQKEARN